MITYRAGSRADDPGTPAARGLKAALARNAKQKAEKERASAAAPASPAPVAPAMPANAGIGGWIPKTAAEKQGFKIGTDRAIDVINSPHFAAHRDLAITLYRNPKLSAAEIHSILALAAAENPAEENKALADMKAALEQARASVGGSNPIGSPASASTAVWEKAIAAVFANEEASA